MIEKLIYRFSKNTCDGNLNLKHLLGSKGANLADMCNIGVRVPPGFTISTSTCNYYYKHNKLPEEIFDQLAKAIEFLEEEVGLKFNDPVNPLLVSIRSGSAKSMPGMLDTILNVGLNDEITEGLAKKSGQRFAYDSYRRFIQMYANTVMKLDNYLFEEILNNKKRAMNIALNNPITDSSTLKEITEEFQEIILQQTNKKFPQNVHDQLYSSIIAVFKSWMNNRAITYREIHNIPHDLGTAVNVQSMVFGNINQNSATGVVFTRNPSTGEKKIFGEFLVNAQGEDIVSGTIDPMPISKMQTLMPHIYDELTEVCNKLEVHYHDMQDIEFTVQNGTLWILQTRSGKRSAQAMLEIAVSMVKENLISKENAILQVDYNSFNQLLHPVLESNYNNIIIEKGLPASPGAASGCVAFTSSDAERLTKDGKKVILIRQETNPEDINGMNSAVGIITLRGGMTSHAAVVARGMGKPCICSASGLFIDKNEEFFYTNNNIKVNKGDNITINGSTGEIILGSIKTVTPQLSQSFYDFMGWLNEIKVIKVMANADTPEDVNKAITFQADGIGLCRTEHMFFAHNRITIMQEMIIASDVQERKKSLAKLEVMQKEDFKTIFSCMAGKQITIRLLDPPLHEFLPNNDAALMEISKKTGKSFSDLKNKVSCLLEKNPMLGHRGCRLAISYPEIYQMQAKAIFTAIKELKEEKGINNIIPEIMIPFIISEKEIIIISELIKNVSIQFNNIPYSIGTMIELPRAALIADKLAKHVHFFSFGTNDLTQATLGISRDDANNFIGSYKTAKIFQHDPFEFLDIEGVGQLIKIASTLGRKSSSNIKIGICGEHGGTAETIELCHKLALNYVSCSPYKIPATKLLAAQYVIAQK
ncbi:pyruvate, phosphate dikinase [Candidatus Neoehrlichia procyonis]|uniref:Pyruvate, phosphate dikinase n=1 Tax=Candidatus Neoehrlichia procyonis str. RAC413 TaxID=1359163 RepID=A0A0F3NQH4_9RICK|nr:pyruvate, phosphate dikinase [Candidatus Neoehrlichia lotoris]KJV69134.1 pyruvate, phosphate dikinase [Candidatus Neoehrlichia lotoris str. RAC413]